MTNPKRKISVTPPEDLSNLKTTEPKSFAAGFPAIKVALDHAIKEMGLKRSLSTLSKLNQEEGIDCPGCAWPDPEKRSNLGEFCENGVKAISEEATIKEVDAAFFAKYSVSEMSRWTDYQIGKSGRITQPMVLEEGSDHYQPIKWEIAYQLVAKHLRNLNNPDEAIFYTSGRSSNEAAFLYGLFARTFGTNNMPDCSNMCHESSGVGLKETLGIGKGSVTLDDFDEAEVVMIMGQNPGTNHPRMLSALEKCKERGGKIITINPLEEAGLVRFKNPQNLKGTLGSGVSLTDVFLQVKVNQDVPLLKLIMKKLLARQESNGNVLAQEFIAQQTAGFEDFVKDLERYNQDELLERCGVPEKNIDDAVDILAKRKRIIICWAMGLTQHKNGVDNIKECVNLLLLKGSIGEKGAGTCPVRGHSNVQGDRTVGIMHKPSSHLNAAFQKVFNFHPPEKEGYDTVKSIKAMHDGQAKVFIALGGNFLSAAPDTAFTGEALQQCELTVSVSTKLNRTHLVPGKRSLILPTLGRTNVDAAEGKNRYVTVENSMGRVHRSKGSLKVPEHFNLRSEPEIVAGIAKAYFGEDSTIDWERMGQDYDLVREKISEVFNGFEDYSNRSKGVGFDLPNNARIADFSKLPGGKAQFSICKLGEETTKQDEFLLTTIRSHDQFNTTIYGMNDRYRGIYNERRVVFMNKEDMTEMNLKKRDTVDLISDYDGQERVGSNFIVVPYNIPKGNLAAYFPETNVLIPHDQYADKSQTPISKSVRVKIRRRD